MKSLFLIRLRLIGIFVPILFFLMNCSEKNSVSSPEYYSENQTEIEGSWQLSKICYSVNGATCELTPHEAGISIYIEIKKNQTVIIETSVDGSIEITSCSYFTFENAFVVQNEDGSTTVYAYDRENQVLSRCCEFTTPAGDKTEATYIFTKS